MEITIIRKYKKENYTVGTMLVNGEKFCDTLEDTDRGLRQDMSLSQIKKLKRYGVTAIPYGTYRITVYFWPKYRRNYPMVNDVPGYTGVLIHGGATHQQTLGCPLIGENRERGKLTNCEKYVRKLTTMCEEAIKKGENVTLTICE